MKKQKQKAKKEAGMFRPKERLIYRYWDGRKERLGDPLALVRRLTTYEGLALEVDAKLASGSTPEAPAALGRIVDATRAVFGVQPLEQGGMTEGECLALLYHFMEFVGEVQRDAGPLLKLPGATAGPAAGGSPTASSRDSGSTATGS